MQDKFCYMRRASGGAAASSPYAVGQTVKTEWKGTWYDAKIIAAKDGQYSVHYDGFEDSWDEWVGTDRLKK